ncbi:MULTISPECIES: hypothetical protein [unclassified Nocardioides]|uniref:hypothetical protein n=1 Tax=unclassified Nocardioides TaxID=2615069 RepID=UPI00361B3E12
MTAPIPEEQDQPSTGGGQPPGEHPSELPSDADRTTPSGKQGENAETSLDEPSDDSGGE